LLSGKLPDWIKVEKAKYPELYPRIYERYEAILESNSFGKMI